jgi:hypothetical protein
MFAVNGTVVRRDTLGNHLRIIGTQFEVDHVKEAEKKIEHSEPNLRHCSTVPMT